MSIKQVLAFPSNEEAPAQARKAVRQIVSGWGYDKELADTAELLVSELVTNVVVHAVGAATCTVICRVRREQLVVAVLDDGRGSPKLRCSRDADTDGRGLLLVDALANSWGVRRRWRGKTTYFCLTLPCVTNPHPPTGPRKRPDANAARQDSRLTRAAQSLGWRFLPAVVRP